jgi:hypothetical protein
MVLPQLLQGGGKEKFHVIYNFPLLPPGEGGWGDEGVWDLECK